MKHFSLLKVNSMRTLIVLMLTTIVVISGFWIVINRDAHYNHGAPAPVLSVVAMAKVSSSAIDGTASPCVGNAEYSSIMKIEVWKGRAVVAHALAVRSTSIGRMEWRFRFKIAAGHYVVSAAIRSASTLRAAVSVLTNQTSTVTLQQACPEGVLPVVLN
jgi:hypothetical protein